VRISAWRSRSERNCMPELIVWVGRALLCERSSFPFPKSARILILERVTKKGSRWTYGIAEHEDIGRPKQKTRASTNSQHPLRITMALIASSATLLYGGVASLAGWISAGWAVTTFFFPPSVLARLASFCRQCVE
jgi:hypothetical protein